MPDNIVVTDPNTPVKLVPGQPVISTTAKLLVAAMPVGTYTFQLEITDPAGAVSRATVQVKVQASPILTGTRLTRSRQTRSRHDKQK